MSNELAIEQKQGVGNTGTQIGVQNNFGLSVSEATQMAFAIFREYYPQLRDEALVELNKLVTEKLNSVSQDCIIPPKPGIAVPALQNASITEEQDIRELYANLLANSMNKVVKHGVHPGFVEIIRQLSPDEAKILRYMNESAFNNRLPTISLRVYKNSGSYSDVIKGFTDVTEASGCEQTDNYQEYIDNLMRLGLIKRSNNEFITDETLYEPLKTHPFIIAVKQQIEKIEQVAVDTKKIDFSKGYIELTAFGKRFCSICLETPKVITLEVQEG